jgi:hypothetical protein
MYCGMLQAQGGGGDALIRGGVVHVVLTAVCYRRGEEAGGLRSGDAAIDTLDFSPPCYSRTYVTLLPLLTNLRETSVLPASRGFSRPLCCWRLGSSLLLNYCILIVTQPLLLETWVLSAT